MNTGVYGIFMLGQGFLIQKSDIPPWFIWIYRIASHTYAVSTSDFKRVHRQRCNEGCDEPILEG
jgi:ABC-type multidrug transport system permease subunit